MPPGSNNPGAGGGLPDPASIVLSAAPVIPVTILTGFLGSGKTTLIRRLLSLPDLRDTAIIVNEFGEIGIDHHILETGDEDTVLLPGGCLCCSASGNLAETLRTLIDRRERRELPSYRRVIIETSGVADPMPLVQTFLSDPIRLSVYRLRSLVALVDGLAGTQTMREHPVARRQAAMADRLFISKTDLSDSDALAGILDDMERLFGRRPTPVPDHRTLSRLLFEDVASPQWPDQPAQHIHASEDYEVVCRRIPEPVTEAVVTDWLRAAASDHGLEVMRIKGLLRGVDGSLFSIDAAQHLWSPPRRTSGLDAEEGVIVVIAVRGSGMGERLLDRLARMLRQ